MQHPNTSVPSKLIGFWKIKSFYRFDWAEPQNSPKMHKLNWAFWTDSAKVGARHEHLKMAAHARVQRKFAAHRLKHTRKGWKDVHRRWRDMPYQGIREWLHGLKLYSISNSASYEGLHSDTLNVCALMWKLMDQHHNLNDAKSFHLCLAKSNY